jgi:hypothetical protein
MLECMILGSGPSQDYDAFLNFRGTRIACDKEYHNLVSKGIHTDYLITLEDGDLSHYFEKPHGEFLPVVVHSLRTPQVTLERLDREDFPMKVYTNEILNVCYSVGTMAWLYAWERLGCKKIFMNGFDSLHQEEGYDLLHHLWRDLFWELHDDYAPKDVETIVKDLRDTQKQKTKDSLSLDRVDSKYPGFDDFKNYIRYRRTRNDNFLLKLKVWHNQ